MNAVKTKKIKQTIFFSVIFLFIVSLFITNAYANCVIMGCVYNNDGSPVPEGVPVNIIWDPSPSFQGYAKNYTVYTHKDVDACHCNGKGNFYKFTSDVVGYDACKNGVFVNASAEYNGYAGYNTDITAISHPSILDIWLNTGLCPQNTTFNITLIQGQNLISSPIIPENDDIEEFLSSITGSYLYVQRVYPWGNGFQIYYPGVPPQFQPNPDFTKINRTMGYIIYAIENKNLQIRGAMSGEICSCRNVSINLTVGQNMVAWISLKSANLSDALSSIDGSYLYVQRVYPKGNGFQIYYPGVPQQFQPNPDFTTVDPGSGYIIYATENVTWTYNPCDF